MMIATATMVEGVGDEVVLGFFVTIGSVLIAIGFCSRRSDSGTIHPERQTDVERVRQQQQQERRVQAPDADRNCPICLGPVNLPVETNCGHTFCTVCIMMCWRQGHLLQPVSCPVCRQTVTLLLSDFTEEEQNSDDARTSQGEIDGYNRRFSGAPRPWIDYLYDMPTLLRHLLRETFTINGLIWMFRFRIIFCLILAILYLFVPFDLLPEGVYGIFGYFDDILVVLLLAIYATILYRNVVAGRAEQ